MNKNKRKIGIEAEREGESGRDGVFGDKKSGCVAHLS